MKFKKQIDEFDVDCDLDWEGIISIEDLRNSLNELEKLGANHIRIEAFMEYDFAEVRIEAVSKRMETNEEFKKRVWDNLLKKSQRRRYELNMLKELKEKYGQL